MKKDNTAYSLWSNIRYLLKRCAQGNRVLLIILIALVPLNILNSLLTMLLPSAVLWQLEQAYPMVSNLLLLILAFTAVLAALGYLTGYLDKIKDLHLVGMRCEQLLWPLLHKRHTMDYSATEQDASINLYQKAIMPLRGNSAAGEEFYRCLVKTAIALVTVLLYGAFLIFLQPLLALLSALLVLPGFFARRKANEWAAVHKEEWTPIDRKLEYVKNTAGQYTCAKDIRLFGLTGWFQDIHHSLLKLRMDWKRKESLRQLLADAAVCMFSFLREGVSYGVLLYMALSGDLTASTFVFYFSMVSSFSENFLEMMNLFAELHRMSLEICDIRSYCGAPDTFRRDPGIPLETVKRPCSIELKKIHFTYDGAKRETVKGVDLMIRPGEKLAVVGLNGAGKTTLIKMICGLCDPTEGEVLISGQNMTEFNRDDYYKMFSTVFQEFAILPISIAETVAAGIEPNRQRVEDCLKQADLYEKILSLPEGMDSKLRKEVYYEAATLSGGETQRLMLARALYKDAPIIILDEPTAALDPIAEAKLYQRYHELTRDKTSIYISHRLSSTQFCDRIVFLEDGKIAEIGTHEELMELKGKYYNLFEVQSEYYKENPQEA